MTKARNQYIYKFTGFILGRHFLQAPPTSKYAEQAYLKLKVALQNQPSKSLQVFKEKLIKPNLWDLLQHTRPKELFTQKYLFKCRNLKGHFYLVDMEAIPSEEITD